MGRYARGINSKKKSWFCKPTVFCLKNNIKTITVVKNKIKLAKIDRIVGVDKCAISGFGINHPIIKFPTELKKLFILEESANICPSSSWALEEKFPDARDPDKKNKAINSVKNIKLLIMIKSNNALDRTLIKVRKSHKITSRGMAKALAGDIKKLIEIKITAKINPDIFLCSNDLIQ